MAAFKIAECNSTSITCDEAIDLKYQMALHTRSYEISQNDLKDAMSVWQKSERDMHLAAKILYLMYKSTYLFIENGTTRKATTDSSKFVAVAAEFVNDVLNNTSSEHLQQYACNALPPIITLSQKCQIVESLDVSSVIMAILGAQRNGVKQLHILWMLMSLDVDLSPSLLDKLTLFLVNAISEHFDSQREIVSASIALLSIVLTKSRPILQANRETVERAIKAVIRVMYDCLDLTGNNPQIFLFGMRCLRLCSVGAFLHDCIVREGGIVAVVDGMNVNFSSVSIQQEGCSILRRISSRSIETKMLIIEADGVDVVLNILVSFDTNTRLVSNALEIIVSLSISRQVRAFFATQGGVIFVKNVMKVQEEESIIQLKGLQALANLASDIDNEAIEMADIPAAVNSSLFNHLSDSAIQEAGVSILKNLR
jgi:hypothetical protein